MPVSAVETWRYACGHLDKAFLGDQRKLIPQWNHFELQVQVEKVYQTEKIDQSSVSLESPVGEEGDEKSTLGNFLADDKILSPAQDASRRILKDQVSEILEDLSKKERKILELRRGINDELNTH